MDAFSNSADSVSAPATRVAAVTPDDTAALPDIPKALYVGIGGDVAVQGTDGADALFRNVPSGAILPIRAHYVRATGTTAAAIVALY